MSIPRIVVAGPTASGKTSLAIALAKHYNGEVVSADSMQIYRGMDIGTAKPTVEEMDGIKHHLIDFLPPQEQYNREYQHPQDTLKRKEQVYQRNKHIVLFGCEK